MPGRNGHPAPVDRPLTVRLRRVRLERVGSLRSAREGAHPPERAEGTGGSRETIVVEVVDADGRSGWGECPALPRPGYTAEYLAGSWAVLRDVLVGVVIDDPVSALATLTRVPGHQMARGALVGALVDLDLRAAGRPLVAALAGGGPTAPTVRSRAVIGIHDTDAGLEAAVAAALDAGHRSVKLKIDPTHDVEPVRTVRRGWPELPLAVDANGSYPDAGAALEACGALERAAGTLDYVEQPLPPDDLVGAAVLTRRLEVPVALDESIQSLGQAVTAVSMGALGVCNLKPARVGGLLEAVAISQVMAAEGIDVFCGGMVESGLGRAAALAVAALPACTSATDLGPSSRYFRRDLTPPFELVDGALEVPDGPGLGVAPDPTALAEATVETWQSP